MTTALQLNAQATIINGHGLQESANLISAISTFQAHPTISVMANTYAVATSSNANVDLLGALSNLCSGVTQNQWVIDAWPGNISPVGSAVSPYSFSSSINSQASLPFSYGMSGFANVFNTAQGFVQQGFETVGSIYMLQGKTYAQSGIGYTGPGDLATNGIDSNGKLLANVINGWGTMYDINNIATAGDPYVFGQNLLNQGFGSYGNLSAKLRSAGLNVNNLSQIPQSSTQVDQQPSTFSATTTVGRIELPVLANVTTTTTVSGNSTDVILSVYQSIVGADLQKIVTATGTTVANTSITSLADYLNFNKITSTADYNSLSSKGVQDFNSFGKFLQSKVGSGVFRFWTDISNLLSNIVVPTLSYTTTTNTDPVLSPTTISTLLASTGTGSGPFNNLLISDLLGACAGMPYTLDFNTLNSNYNNATTNKVYLAAVGLNSAVNDYAVAYDASLGDPPGPAPDITGVNANVGNVNTQLNSLGTLGNSQTAYYQMLNQLQREVNNLHLAGVTFNSGYTGTLKGFAQGFSSTASDTTRYQTYQFFANLYTNDIYGDTLRSAVIEEVNTQILGSGGITVKNDPNPSMALFQSQQQNIPLSTYLSQNK
jgi:hypothetical protein